MAFEVGPFERPLDPDVRLALDVATLEAAAEDHESIEAEHVALALLADPELVRLLDRVGARTEAIEGVLEDTLAPRRRVSSLDGERPMSLSLSFALRTATGASGGLERETLLTALVAQSPVAPEVAAAGASAAQLLAASRLVESGASAGSPYRAPRADRSWTLHLTSGEVVPRTLRTGVAQLLGLSRFASARAALGASRPEGVDVGLFSEADAKDFATTVLKHATDAGLSLGVEARPCRSDATLSSVRRRVRRWWRTVQLLRGAAVVLAVVAMALVAYRARQTGFLNGGVLTMSQALASPDGDVRVSAQIMPDAPRFLLPEGEPFLADPRTPEAIGTPFFENSRVGTRVSIRYFSEPVFSFEADREIRTAHGTRTTPARWEMLTCPNCTSDILVVRSGRSVRQVEKAYVEATILELGDAGRSAADLKSRYRAHGGLRDIAYVLDVDPLPEGPTQKLIPICLNDGIVSARCTPYIWGFESRSGARLPSIRDSVLEGRLGTSEDPRLRVAVGPSAPARSGGHARTLQLGPMPPSRPRFPVGIASCSLAALLFGAIAQQVRRLGRPARDR